MTELEQINRAIENHGYWKVRLLQAITTDDRSWRPSYILDDRICEFGRWLYSLSATEKETEQWQKVRALHEQFHIAAAKVLYLAIDGQKEKALALIDDAQGEYKRTSIRLMYSLYEWGKTVIGNLHLMKLAS